MPLALFKSVFSGEIGLVCFSEIVLLVKFVKRIVHSLDSDKCSKYFKRVFKYLEHFKNLENPKLERSLKGYSVVRNGC